MTLRTKLFGRKIQGEALENLLKAIGRDPERVLNTSRPHSQTKKVYGRYIITPEKEGLNVDLYIIRTDIHDVKSTFGVDDWRNGVGLPEEHVPYTYGKHMTGKIKYGHKEEK